MISKKLLGEVFSINVENDIILEHNIIHYEDIGMRIEINIHELAHKCKVWALQYKYELLSGYLSSRGYVVVMEQRRTWYADTESEAIFKACEWILKQKAES